MRTLLFIFVVAAIPLGAMAQQQATPVVKPAPATASQVSIGDPSEDQVQAAIANATAILHDQILHTRISREFTVEEFLDKTNSQGELNRVLKSAKSVGGVRWVDDRTCQVRLELPAPQVAAMLMGIAHTPNIHPPITAETLKEKLVDWKSLKFTGVGCSAGGESIENARLHESAGRWSEVTDSARKLAISQALTKATEQMHSAMGPIVLHDRTHISDALARPVIAAKFNDWLRHEPVTRINFTDDLKVSVTISTSSNSLATAFKSAVESDTDFAHGSAIDWDKVNVQIDTLPTSVDGTGQAVLAGPATSLPSIVLPLQPPDWIDQQLQADATASGGGSRLKVGRTAETEAIGKIREQFLQLHIDSTTTLGDAAHSDPQLNQAVDRAMLHAHASRVDYKADGSVKVLVTLDLRDAWDALRSDP